jgi:phosphomannomutase
MNRAVVRKVAWALGQFLREMGLEQRVVVVGFDARPSSRLFAEDTCAVLSGQGVAVRAFEQPVPTPFVAYACRALNAAAGVVVTASHNPREDNGYKVYDDRGAQIVAPWDERIAALMAEAPPANQIQENDALRGGVPASLIDEYFAELRRFEGPKDAAPGVSETRRELRIAYTPLHGVGLAPLRRALAPSGVELCVVESQAEPDGTFPTTPFPNPEEPGTLDLLRELAEREGCDLALANDPDADRLAVCVPHGGPGSGDQGSRHRDFRMLSGDEVGVLLADFVLQMLPSAAARDLTPVIAASIVSSPLIEAVASAAGARVARTLTGFKWLCRVPEYLAPNERFVFAFEEALGYAVAPDLVRDKDGIFAARALVTYAQELARRGSGLLGRLHELFGRHGLWVSSPKSVRLSGGGAGLRMQSALQLLRRSPPTQLAGLPVTDVVDYATGAEERPPYLGAQELLVVELGSRGRVLVRPSGTEPKLKLYVHLCTAVHSEDDIARGRTVLHALGSRVANELIAATGLA